MLEPIWPVASAVLDGGFAVELDDVADAIKLLVEKNRVVAEGAGACPVAAARSGMATGAKKIVCVVSGGGLDTDKLVAILSGKSGRSLTNGKGTATCPVTGHASAESMFAVVWHAAWMYTACTVGIDLLKAVT